LKKISVKHIYIFVLIGILYFSGISAIVYPMISNVYSLVNSKSEINTYDKEIKEMPDNVIDEKLKKANQYNSDLAKRKYDDGLERSLCNESGLMCYVDIPTIGVYLPVYYGTTDEVLLKGCGCLENTSLPVGGASTHSVLSAHTGLPSAEMFTKLDQVKMSEVFYIHVLDKVLAYKIDRIEAVTPDKVELLDIVKDKDYCTLLTCTPYGINDKRLLVRGERIPYEVLSDDEENTAVPIIAENADSELEDNIRHQVTVIVGIIAVSVVIYVCALIWVVLSVRKAALKRQKDAEEADG